MQGHISDLYFLSLLLEHCFRLTSSHTCMIAIASQMMVSLLPISPLPSHSTHCRQIYLPILEYSYAILLLKNLQGLLIASRIKSKLPFKSLPHCIIDFPTLPSTATTVNVPLHLDPSLHFFLTHFRHFYTFVCIAIWDALWLFLLPTLIHP